MEICWQKWFAYMAKWWKEEKGSGHESHGLGFSPIAQHSKQVLATTDFVKQITYLTWHWLTRESAEIHCVHARKSKCVWARVQVWVHASPSVCACARECVCVQVRVRSSVCACESKCVWVQVRVHARASPSAWASPSACAYPCVCVLVFGHWSVLFYPLS